MDKTLIIFVGLGIAGIYYTTNFIGKVQKEDERFQNEEYKEEQRLNQYDTVDSIGQDILDLTEVSSEVQVEVWNKSQLREEYMSLFPNFSEMKKFVGDRLRGEALQAKLLHSINSVEDQFFSGAMSMEKAKRKLRYLR
jgi:hypothetical protein